jgi:hypothetical protein
VSDQRRFDIPAGLEWRPPAVPVITEEKRRQIQSNLEYWKTFGGAVDRSFDVAEEMKRRGLKTNAEVEAERQAKIAKAINAAFDEAEARLDAQLTRRIDHG